MASFLEDLPDVIDGEVLFAGLDNLVPERVRFRGGFGALGRGNEEGSRGILPKIVDQDAKTSGRVAKAAGGLLGRELVDEEGAQGLVLAVGGIGGLEKNLGEIS